MIPRSAITHWNKQVPWEDIANVEQDLIITRALTDIFSDEFLASELAFRGGTALHKLYLAPQPRYSEDIDLVQINPGPIKPILFRLGEVLDYLPDKVIKPKRFNNTMLFRIQSEIPPVVQIRLKVEINCYEHLMNLALSRFHFLMRVSGLLVHVISLPTNWKSYWGQKCERFISARKAATFLTLRMHFRMLK